jgi:undecaprenyl-diphosphatase
LLGLTREAAARYSFLLSIPIIVLSGLGVTKDLVSSTEAVDWMALSLGTVVAAISAFACIHFFLSWINKMGMLPFVIYRLLLGALLLWLFL